MAELIARQLDPHRIAGLDMSAFTRPAQHAGQVTELIPGAINPYFVGGPVQINAAGLRGPELDESRALPRFLAVGDSVTFGYGVRHEETWIAQLADERAAMGLPVEVVNGGLSGAGLRYYRTFLQRRCAEIGPAHVLVGLVINDIVPYRTEAAPSAAHRRRSTAQLNHSLMRASHLYTASVPLLKGLAYRTGVLDLNDNPGFAFVALDADSPVHNIAWQTSLALLDDIVDEVDACGARFTLVMFPVETQLSQAALRMYRDGLGVHITESAMAGGPQQRVQAWADARGVDMVDLLGEFRSADPATGSLYLRNDAVAIDPVHLSPRGNAVAAAAIAEHLAADPPAMALVE